MQQIARQKELLRVLVIAGLGLALGWSLGYPLMGLMIGLLVVIVLMYRTMLALYRWSLRQGPRPEDGLIGYSTDRILLREKNLKHKIQLLTGQIQRYKQGIESLHDGVVTLNADGHIVAFNSSAARLLGLRKEDIGQPVTNLLRNPRFTRYFKAGDYSSALQFDINHRRLFSLQVQITPFGDDQKVMLVKDITERKRVETMRQNFIADVSHELRTPLTVINGYLEMLGDMELPPALAKAISQMDSQGQRMKTLVNDLIQLSKLESTNSEQRGDWFDLQQLSHAVIDQLHPLSEGRIRLHCPQRIDVCGHAEEMSSVLSNLLTNAVKYGGDGQIDLNIRAGMDGVKVSITDHGPGIPAQHISRLTERFYRVDDSRESTLGGSGLGLAIVKHALDHHDTVLDIESTLGKGSTFSFTLPADRCRISEQE
ncbi:phosphate regulon sensor histidine kinase PhoR [Venatoribacter cucullus]|uniref:Phosphate regulon sensor protein PhoR n=1 Tax=Venatoribacter cucullus TaxID=2661630 RepID=A0A9X7UU50_9GAMM|nr:phosphate regulon sensor histidine kinase PhoR [Venatoribacter cucullus]QQD23049.1 phosphate regulon sensor histidine kinase PhoR [Venatoribacter cucullus]